MRHILRFLTTVTWIHFPLCYWNIEIGSVADILVTITKLSIILEGSGVVDIPSMFLAIGNDSSGIEMKCWKKKGGGGDAVAFVVSVRERRSGEAWARISHNETEKKMHALDLTLLPSSSWQKLLQRRSHKRGESAAAFSTLLLYVLKPSQPQDLRTWGVTLLFINLPDRVPYQQTVRIRLSKNAIQNTIIVPFYLYL